MVIIYAMEKSTSRWEYRECQAHVGRFVEWSGKASLIRGHLSRFKGSEGANHANV